MSKNKRTKNEACVVCCKNIVEGKDEALMCEGEVCGNKWMHRYCAGVPTTHYKLLERSPDPFHCYLCMQLKHVAIVKEMKSAITNLTAEVAELRAALQSATRSCPDGQVQTLHDASQAQSDRMWNEVVRRGRQQTSKNNRGSRPMQRTQQPANRPPQSLIQNAKDGAASARRVKISGVRRVWGKKKDAPSSVVLQTVRQLTKADPENKLTVKRKFKEGRYGRRDRWWFLLHGPETILEELSSAWSTVSLQVGWKLEECTNPYEDEIVVNGENVGEQNGESHIATNATELSESGQASTKDTLPAINSGTTDNATPYTSESPHGTD